MTRSKNESDKYDIFSKHEDDKDNLKHIFGLHGLVT